MPESQAFPSDVESFIAYCINSVEQVEILLLLRAHAERRWTIAELSEHLRSSKRSVGLRVTSLVAHGLVARDGTSFRYSANAEDDALVQRLGAVYEERRTAVIDRIFSEGRDPLQRFADAFRFREDVTDG